MSEDEKQQTAVSASQELARAIAAIDTQVYAAILGHLSEAHASLVSKLQEMLATTSVTEEITRLIRAMPPMTDLQRALNTLSPTAIDTGSLQEQIKAIAATMGEPAHLVAQWESIAATAGIGDSLRAVFEKERAGMPDFKSAPLPGFTRDYPNLATIDRAVAGATGIGSLGAVIQATQDGSFGVDAELVRPERVQEETSMEGSSAVAVVATTSLDRYQRTMLAGMLFQSLLMLLATAPSLWTTYAKPLLRLIEELLR